MKFAEIVRSSPQVGDAFDDAGVYALWWRLLLALHGKPVSTIAKEAEVRTTLTRGFRFYACLYIALAVALLFAAFIVWCVGLPSFWTWLLVGSSAYLLATSQLAFVGSRNFLDFVPQARPQLVTYFVSIIAFLSCFCGVCAAVVHFAIPTQGFVLFVGLATLLTCGVGSYVIEIVYLPTNSLRVNNHSP